MLVTYIAGLKTDIRLFEDKGGDGSDTVYTTKKKFLLTCTAAAGLVGTWGHFWGPPRGAPRWDGEVNFFFLLVSSAAISAWLTASHPNSEVKQD